MSDEELKSVDPSEADTVVPNTDPAAAPPRKWQMPEPVFQHSSGYLPQGFEKRFPQPPPPAPGAAPAGGVGPADEVAAQPTDPPVDPPFDANITMVGAPKPMAMPAAPSAPPASIPPIEPQPEFPDNLASFDDTIPQSAAAAPAPKKRGGIRTAIIVVGILIVLAFVAVFLAAAYFLYFLPSSEAGNL